jgi:hypothetical protein
MKEPRSEAIRKRRPQDLIFDRLLMVVASTTILAR